MAKETKASKSTRALTGLRILSKPISNYSGTKEEGALPSTLDWLGEAGSLIYAEDYFDLSGYELDDLTLIPRSIGLQDGLPYFSEAEALMVYDIVSQERLTPGDFPLYYLAGDYPSSKGSSDDWSQILYCQTRFFAPTLNNTFATLLTSATTGSFGSLEPTAVQKLWCYRIILPLGMNDGMALKIPATRFVLNAEIVDEPELEYMMRLKRSYELSN